MSLHVLSAHTGASYEADPNLIRTLEDLRSWIARESTISTSHQILMTARGKQAKVQNIPTEQEIFLYDRRVLASVSPTKATTLLPKDEPPNPFRHGSPLDNAASYDTLQSWQTSFKSRRAWAIGLTDGSRNVVDGIGKVSGNIDIITRGVAIAVDNIKQHVASLRSKYNESKAWADQICDDQAFLLGNWQHALEVLQSIRADGKLGQCLHGIDVIPTRLKSEKTEITLLDFVDSADVKAAANSGENILKHFSDRVGDLGATFDTASNESSKIVDKFVKDKHTWIDDTCDQADRLMEEIEVLTKKINADYEHILALPNTPKSISQASKIAQLHKGNFTPSLVQANEEINQLLAQVLERKEQVKHASIQYLQDISVVESTVSAAHTKLAKLDIDDSSGQIFDTLNFVIRLPVTYGSLLVECVRRQEWADKMTTDSSSLVEEIATYKEDELKRRKRWIKDLDGAINLQSLDDMALGIEVNVQSQRQKWPKVTREDVHDFLYRLNEAGDLDGAVEVVEGLVKTLDAPSKQQARRAKAFKNGSVHDAAYGKTSLLLRGDDEVLLNMRNEKSKAEDRLKSAESRIRKLEDLLHRHSQVGPFSRPTSATNLAPVAPTFERYATSPVPNFSSALSKARETGSRRSSVSSRRISMNNESEEKGLAQRIVSLEADLIKERANSADLVKKAAARSNAEDLLKSQVREATSTKEDLLGNLEAQQKEFDDERRLLHDEKAALTIKIEEIEDEFDRVLGSREHEDRTRALEEELEQVRTTTINEMERAQHQLEILQDSHTKQRDQIEMLEREVQQQKDDYNRLDGKADHLTLQQERQGQLQANHHRALQTTLQHLSQDDAPEDFGALVEKLGKVAERSATHLKDLQNALASLRANNQTLETRYKGQTEDLYSLMKRLSGEESNVFSLREELDTLQKEGIHLQTQLDSERGESAQLRSLLAQSEVDSKALRDQLTAKESTIADMSDTISRHDAQRRDLSNQLSEHTTSLEDMRSRYENLKKTQDAQVSRSITVSERMVKQDAALERLLEHIGLTVIKEEGIMVIQKAPRASSASTTLADPSASMKRSLSGPMPVKTDPEITMEPKVLRWAEAENVEELESHLSAFTKEIDIFDIEKFSEGVYKRVKEIEHIARKWQKEARAYRDKSHRAQGDAHDRIALRNFKEGDLALFLPTRDQATKPWAAFNVGAPHCFLREQDSHNLSKRDWLIARISKVEERVVDLSKSINGGLKGSGDQRSGGDKSDTGAFPNDENPYELSDGLRWYLIDAAEEKPGAPINIGTGKVTVASTNVDAKGSIRIKKPSDGNAATKTLTRSLDSRRSSTNSRKGLVAVSSNTTNGPTELEGMLEQSIDNAAAAAAATSNFQRGTDGQDVLQTDQPQSSQTEDVGASCGLGHEHAPSLATSPSKSSKTARSSPQKAPKSKAWDSLWSLDLNLESGKDDCRFEHCDPEDNEWRLSANSPTQSTPSTVATTVDIGDESSLIIDISPSASPSSRSSSDPSDSKFAREPNNPLQPEKGSIIEKVPSSPRPDSVSTAPITANSDQHSNPNSLTSFFSKSPWFATPPATIEARYTPPRGPSSQHKSTEPFTTLFGKAAVSTTSTIAPSAEHMNTSFQKDSVNITTMAPAAVGVMGAPSVKLEANEEEAVSQPDESTLRSKIVSLEETIRTLEASADPERQSFKNEVLMNEITALSKKNCELQVDAKAAAIREVGVRAEVTAAKIEMEELGKSAMRTLDMLYDRVQESMWCTSWRRALLETSNHNTAYHRVHLKKVLEFYEGRPLSDVEAVKCHAIKNYFFFEAEIAMDFLAARAASAAAKPSLSAVAPSLATNAASGSEFRSVPNATPSVEAIDRLFKPQGTTNPFGQTKPQPSLFSLPNSVGQSQSQPSSSSQPNGGFSCFNAQSNKTSNLFSDIPGTQAESRPVNRPCPSVSVLAPSISIFSFRATEVEYSSGEKDVLKDVFQSISCMEPYKKWSFEELRLSNIISATTLMNAASGFRSGFLLNAKPPLDPKNLVLQPQETVNPLGQTKSQLSLFGSPNLFGQTQSQPVSSRPCSSLFSTPKPQPFNTSMKPFSVIPLPQSEPKPINTSFFTTPVAPSTMSDPGSSATAISLFVTEPSQNKPSTLFGNTSSFFSSIPSQEQQGIKRKMEQDTGGGANQDINSATNNIFRSTNKKAKASDRSGSDGPSIVKSLFS